MSLADAANRIVQGGFAYGSAGNAVNWPDILVNQSNLVSRASTAMTSFDEVSVSQAETLIDLKSVYPISQLRDVIIASNGGAVTQVEGTFKISTTTNADSEVIFRSVERGRYIAGLDALAGIGIRAPIRPTGNQVIEWGYTDFVNGFVAGEDATGVFMAIYSGGTQTHKVYRDNWINPLDSGDFIFTPSELNIYRFPFRWYGRGPVKLDIAGEKGEVARIFRAHQLKLSNDIITQDPNQPLAVRVKNNGTAAAMDVYCAGRNFTVRGGNLPSFRLNSEIRTGVTVGTTFLPLVSARQKNTDYNSISVKLSGIDILTTDNIIYHVIVLPATLTGPDAAAPDWQPPTYSNSGVESAMEFDITATAVSGGISIFKGIAPGASGNKSSADVRDLPNLELPADGGIVVLMAKAITGTSTVSAELKIREEW